MDPDYYLEMHANEDHHWWFVARRRIVRRVLDRFVGRRPEGKVLEAGCGPGGNLALLAEYGEIHALELDDDAREMANARGIAKVEPGCLPEEIPFEQSFDLICALDVIEHIEEDIGAMRALGEKLLPGGRLLLTVPAYRFLWSHHDVVTHHVRRYTKTDFVKRVESAGLRIRYATYFNTFLFPAIWAIRAVNRLLDRKEGSDVKMPSAPMNKLLNGIFSLERFLLPGLRFPFGVSILVLAEPAPVPTPAKEPAERH
jgi:SAM-dependent methyltransferase